MIIPIIGRSAVEFWLGPAVFTNFAFNMHQEVESFPERFDFGVTAHTAKHIAQCLGLTLPLETFSFERNHYQNGKALHVVTKYSPFPPNSFVHIKKFGHDLFIARPELCFLQAANYMTLPQLVQLGMQLCGLYCISGKSELKSRVPLTNAGLIKLFLKSAAGHDGVKPARRAAFYIVDNANSPMEAALATVMILPAKYGGYAMSRFTMNEPIKLSRKAAAYFGCGELRGDFHWRRSRLIAEYNSKAYHLDPRQQAKDANRLNAMQASGYTVVPITYNDLRLFDNVENQMKLLMDMLGRPQLEGYEGLRKELCRELLGSL